MYNIMIVDDHPPIRRVLKAALVKAGRFRVIGDVSRGSDVMPFIERHKPDLVVLDLELEPGFSPEGAIRQIHDYDEAIKIVIYSAHSNLERVELMIDLDVDGYITKAEDVPDVARYLDEIMRGQRYYSPGVSSKVAQLAKTQSRFRFLAREERHVLQMLADGKTVNQIAIEMNVSTRTVRKYAGLAKVKLRATSWEHAIALALRKGMLT